jgi:phosphoserine phosphatase
MRGIVFFDVDGTLVPGGSSAQHLAVRLGHLAAVRAAEDLWDRGLVSGEYCERLDAEAWSGRSLAEVGSWLDDLPLVDGIPEVLAWCRSHDLQPVLATLAWQAVVDHLATTFGFVGGSGARVRHVDGTYTGEVERSFDEYAKRDLARAVAAQNGLSLAQCIAIGDSRSDLPLFAEVGLAVGFNADPPAAAAAHRVVDGNDLRAVLPVLEEWLDGAAAKRFAGGVRGPQAGGSHSSTASPSGS